MRPRRRYPSLVLVLAALPPLVASGDTFVVTSTADSGEGSLREAVALANQHEGLDAIHFAVPEESCSAAGVCGIGVATPVVILDPVEIDGTTQPRYGSAPENVCATETAPSFMRIEVVSPASPWQEALALSGSGTPGVSTIRGLSIGGGVGLAIRLAGAHRLQCSHVGVDGTGTAALPSVPSSLLIEGGADGTLIGTDGDGIDDLAERNLFAGAHAIFVNANSNLRIAGNYFGLLADGTDGLGCDYGVFLRQSSFANLVGTDFDGVSDDLERNVFGGCYIGIWFDSYAGPPGGENVAAGNWVGLDASGAPLARGSEGIRIEVATDEALVRYNRVEGRAIGVRVLDSYYGTGAAFAEGSEGNCLVGNTVGLSQEATSALAFERNWWGAADGPSGLFTGSGDSVAVTGSGSVDTAPWLTEGCPAPEPAAGAAALAALTALGGLARRRGRSMPVPPRTTRFPVR